MNKFQLSEEILIKIMCLTIYYHYQYLFEIIYPQININDRKITGYPEILKNKNEDNFNRLYEFHKTHLCPLLCEFF